MSSLFFSHSNLNYLFNIVNNELKSVANWFRLNKLSLNVAKTSYMLFSNSANHLLCEVIMIPSLNKMIIVNFGDCLFTLD